MAMFEAFSVAAGAALGALVRWGLSLSLNPLFPTVPLGTLAANLVGGFLVGMAVTFFVTHAGIPAELRLFVITGFLGGLTTFSTFSAEVVGLLASGQWAWAVAAISAHLLGSLLLTLLGMASANTLMRGLAG
jgi:CrcB protein